MGRRVQSSWADGVLAGAQQGRVQNTAGAGGGELELGEVLGVEFTRGRRISGRAGVHTSDDAGNFTRHGDGDGDHGVRDNPEAVVENRAVLGVLGNRVLANGLRGGVHEADDAVLERLLEPADKLVGVGTGAEGGVEMVLAGEPEGGVFGSGSGGSAQEKFAQEAAGGLVDRAGGDPVGRL